MLEQAKANDQLAWAKIRDLYVPLVYQWCRLAGVKADEIPDLSQEVMLAVARKLPTFRKDRDHHTFRGWLRRITQNKIKDAWRSKRLRPDAKGGSDAQRMASFVPVENRPDDDPHRDDNEIRLLYARAIEIITSEFPAWYRLAFQRTVIGDESVADVAADLGKKASAVYNATSRVRCRLREEFSDVLE